MLLDDARNRSFDRRAADELRGEYFPSILDEGFRKTGGFILFRCLGVLLFEWDGLEEAVPFSTSSRKFKMSENFFSDLFCIVRVRAVRRASV